MLLAFSVLCVASHAVTGSLIRPPIQPLINTAPGLNIMWEARTMISSTEYPCKEDKFYTHPSNCSRFYRCVSFEKSSDVFSRFLFECPSGNVFVEGLQTCIPGTDCPKMAKTTDATEEVLATTEAAMGEDAIPTEASAAEVGGSDGGTVGSDGGTDGSVGEAVGLDGGAAGSDGAAAGSDSGAAGLDEGAVGSDGGAAGSDSGTAGLEDGAAGSDGGEAVLDSGAAGSSSNGGAEGSSPALDHGVESSSNCIGMYEQHLDFCNVFHLCGNDAEYFFCIPGTAFNEEKQMCRLSAADSTLCAGKSLYDITNPGARFDLPWEQVGVIPLPISPVPNAEAYSLTSINHATKNGLIQIDPTDVFNSHFNPMHPYGSSHPSLYSSGYQPIVNPFLQNNVHYSSLMRNPYSGPFFNPLNSPNHYQFPSMNYNPQQSQFSNSQSSDDQMFAVVPLSENNEQFHVDQLADQQDRLEQLYNQLHSMSPYESNVLPYYASGQASFSPYSPYDQSYLPIPNEPNLDATYSIHPIAPLPNDFMNSQSASRRSGIASSVIEDQAVYPMGSWTELLKAKFPGMNDENAEKASVYGVLPIYQVKKK